MAKVKVKKSELWKAIKAKCLDCSGYSIKERRLCPVTDCPLYEYRLGTETPPLVKTTPHKRGETKRKPN